MRSGSRPVRPVLVPVLAALLLLALPTGVAQAAPKRRPPAPPPAGLTADVARFEPLEGNGTVQVDGRPSYRGILELRRTAAGVGAVNEVPFEDYLKGIAEMPSGWPAEAQRAQAIAARTYALWTMQAGPAGEARGLGAHICATEGCQVYAGTQKAESPGGGNWAAAVEATRGQVLLHQGKPILAKYSSSNGGRSAGGGRPYLRAVDDPDDARSPLHRWQLTVSFDDIGRALAAPGPVVAVGRPGGGDVVVDWAAADGATGRLTVTPPDFRAKVNAAVAPPPGRSRTVPSPFFSVRADGGARVAVLDGRGYGHAIGMSQYGAYGKALRGMSAAAILAAYYGGIKPTTLPPERLPDTVRVAIDPGRPQIVAGASTPFRILDGNGRVIAHIASGRWRVVPAKGGVRLVPPADQAGPPAVEVLAVDPPDPRPGQAVTVRFRPTVAAMLRAVAQPPGGVEVELLSSRPLGPAETSLVLPPAARSGSYFVSFVLDAGGGRTAVQALVPQVVSPVAAVSAADRRLAALAVRASPPGERAAPARPAGVPAVALAGIMGAVAFAGAGAGWRLGRRRRLS